MPFRRHLGQRVDFLHRALDALLRRSVAHPGPFPFRRVHLTECVSQKVEGLVLPLADPGLFLIHRKWTINCYEPASLIANANGKHA